MKEIITDAGDIAKKRFFEYLDEKLTREDDLTRWEFFNHLLEQAKKHKPDISGYACLEYQQDRDYARNERRKREAEYKEGVFRLPAGRRR